jgi:hypothetical protein
LKIASAGSIVDAAGNALAGTPVSGPSYTVDKAPPTVSLSSTPPNPSTTASSTFTWTGGDPLPGTGVASYLCSIDGAAFRTCAQGTPSLPYTFTVNQPGDAQHVFEVTSGRSRR